MDFQNRVGSKKGGGGVASESQANADRRERLRKLALETIDLSKDPYFLKNHLGSYECRLCLTLHTNEGSYLAHTQGKKHQNNLEERAAKEAKNAEMAPAAMLARRSTLVKKIVKIGRPGFRATKIRDPVTRQEGLLFQIDYPEITENIVPRYRFMSAYEQKVEAPSRAYQYLLFAAEPYETIAFKLQSREVDKVQGRMFVYWDRDEKSYTMQFFFTPQAVLSNPDGSGSGGSGGGGYGGGSSSSSGGGGGGFGNSNGGGYSSYVQ